MAKTGRPSKQKDINLEQVEKLALKGWTDKEMSSFFGVCRKTWHNWKTENKDFLHTIKKSKDAVDRHVERSLYERATGYEHPDVHITNYQGKITETNITKHYPPDTGAMALWLKNRQPNKWLNAEKFLKELDKELENTDLMKLVEAIKNVK